MVCRSAVTVYHSNLATVCKTDDACRNFPLPDWAKATSRLVNGHLLPEDDEGSPAVNMTCYTGGETVVNNHQMCDVTSKLSFLMYSVVSPAFLARVLTDAS